MKIIHLINKYKKHITIYTAAALVLVLLFAAVSTTVIMFRVDTSRLHNKIEDFFDVHMNKAVKFDDISFGITGTVYLQNFHLSSASDFHEGNNMVRADRIKIRFSYLSLLSGEPCISAIEIDEPDLNLIKSMHESHLETLKNLFSFEVSESDTNIVCPEKGILFIIKRASLSYREFSRRAKFNIELHPVNMEISFNRNRIIFNIQGHMESERISYAAPASVILSGKYFDSKNFEISCNIDLFPIVHINSLFNNSAADEYLFSGLFSTSASVFMNDGLINTSGKTELSDFGIKKRIGRHNFLSNYDIVLEHQADYHPETEVLRLQSFRINDGNIKGDLRGDFTSDIIDMKFQVDIASLRLLNTYLNLIPGYFVSGTVNSSGNLNVDYSDSDASETTLFLKAAGLTLIPEIQVEEKRIIHEGQITVSFEEKILKILFNGGLERGDLSLASETLIKSWKPVSTESVIAVNSEKFEGKYFYRFFKEGLIALNKAAVKGTISGMHDVLFLQKPVGQFIQNNNFKIQMRADSILAGKSAEFSDFKTGISLNRGILSLDNFSLSGYDADYDLSLKAFFNREVPHIAIDGNFSGLNLEYFYNDYGTTGTLSGNLSGSLNYEFTGYRIDQFLSSSRGQISLVADKGKAVDTPFQRKLYDFFKNNGYDIADLSGLGYTRFYTSANLLRDTFYIRVFSLNSDIINYHGYGRYTFADGISLNLSPQIETAEGGKKQIGINLTGALTQPCLLFKEKEGVELCF